MVQKYKLPLNERDVMQICLMIEPDDTRKNLWPYQIIANKMCQIDVDKLDYIRRDCYHLGIEMTDNFSRIISNARVVKTPKGNEVLLKTVACGVCHSDVHIHDGYFDLGGGVQLPSPLP